MLSKRPPNRGSSTWRDSRGGLLYFSAIQLRPRLVMALGETRETEARLRGECYVERERSRAA